MMLALNEKSNKNIAIIKILISPIFPIHPPWKTWTFKYTLVYQEVFYLERKEYHRSKEKQPKLH